MFFAKIQVRSPVGASEETTRPLTWTQWVLWALGWLAAILRPFLFASH